MPARNSAAAVSVAIATISMWPSGRPRIASRAASLASAWTTAAPPSAFGSMMASGRAGTTASRSASVSPVARPLTRTKRRGRLRRLDGVREEIAARLRACGFALRRDRILEIDDHRVGAARHRLVELPAAIGGDEQQGAHVMDLMTTGHGAARDERSLPEPVCTPSTATGRASPIAAACA